MTASLKKPWRFLNDAPQSAAVNMATDEAIALAFSLGKVSSTLRFYRWTDPTFSIGAFQSLEKTWISSMGEKAIPIIRRITGGRGLLHDDELTYSVISNTHDPRFSPGLKETFQAIAKGLLAGLNRLGVDAAVYTPSRSERSGQKNPLCFDAVSRYEITAKGKKLIGSAQRRWKSHFLQHGSLILRQFPEENRGEHPESVLISENQICLSDLCPTALSYEAMIQSLKAGFEDALSIDLKPGRLSPYEEEIIRQLIQEKYGLREWNLYRKVKNPSARD